LITVIGLVNTHSVLATEQTVFNEKNRRRAPDFPLFSEAEDKESRLSANCHKPTVFNFF
jgi:hypothetical protein